MNDSPHPHRSVSFGFLKTGKIPIGQSLISINSWGMSHVLNKDFSNYYPYRTVDQINFKRLDIHKKNFDLVKNSLYFFFCL